MAARKASTFQHVDKVSAILAFGGIGMGQEAPDDPVPFHDLLFQKQVLVAVGNPRPPDRLWKIPILSLPPPHASSIFGLNRSSQEREKVP
jgi:hypothetical protein